MTGKKQQRATLQLKNGAIADVRAAVIVLGDLRAMLDVHPERLDSLLALAQGRTTEVRLEHLKELQERNYVGLDGKVRQDVADVLLSSFQMRAEGPVLVNPFELKNENDKLVADHVYEQVGRDLIDIVLGRGRRGRT